MTGQRRSVLRINGVLYGTRIQAFNRKAGPAICNVCSGACMDGVLVEFRPSEAKHASKIRICNRCMMCGPMPDKQKDVLGSLLVGAALGLAGRHMLRPATLDPNMKPCTRIDNEWIIPTFAWSRCIEPWVKKSV